MMLLERENHDVRMFFTIHPLTYILIVILTHFLVEVWDNVQVVNFPQNNGYILFESTIEK